MHFVALCVYQQPPTHTFLPPVWPQASNASAACTQWNLVRAGLDWPPLDAQCNWTCSGTDQSPINLPSREPTQVMVCHAICFGRSLHHGRFKTMDTSQVADSKQ
jgi:hypothetical protein